MILSRVSNADTSSKSGGCTRLVTCGDGYRGYLAMARRHSMKQIPCIFESVHRRLSDNLSLEDTNLLRSSAAGHLLRAKTTLYSLPYNVSLALYTKTAVFRKSYFQSVLIFRLLLRQQYNIISSNGLTSEHWCSFRQGNDKRSDSRQVAIAGEPVLSLTIPLSLDGSRQMEIVGRPESSLIFPMVA